MFPLIRYEGPDFVPPPPPLSFFLKESGGKYTVELLLITLHLITCTLPSIDVLILLLTI